MIDPPYPADLEAKGWALDLDYEKIDQSETWPIAAAHPADEGGFTPELRPWLLMTWLSAWKQVPIASFPQNDRLIAAIIGMPFGQFIASKDVLLSGFELATDGRMYHRTLSACALKMASKRDKDRARVAAFRAKSLVSNESVAASNEGVAASNALQVPINENVAACNALPTRDSTVSSAPLPTPTPLPTPINQKQVQHAPEIQNSESELRPETRATMKMIEAGMTPTKCNPHDPRLSAAIAEGVTPELLASLVPNIPPNAAQPMAWVVAAARGQLADSKTRNASASAGAVASVAQNDHTKTMAEVLRGS